ncbi:MAG: nucleotidyltransferase domain-containing protein [Nanoarchaeota archaeon]|nr:nucleotidyltransferase domain-containing protein [Nanoarchaeota archaeon]
MDNLLDLVYVLGKHLGENVTLRQLALEAGVPYTTAYRAVKLNNSLFELEKKGSATLCSLNTKDMIILSHLSLAERKKADDFCRKNKEISVIRADLPEGNYSAVLFGSRAGGKHRKDSDIDLMVINKDGKKNIGFSKHEMLFKIRINPIFMTAKEFRHMLKEKEHNLADEVIKNHIVLHGESYFWRTVLEDGI